MPSSLLPPPHSTILSGKFSVPNLSIISCLIKLNNSMALSLSTCEICLFVISNVLLESFCFTITFSAILSFSGVQLVSNFN